MPDWIVPVLEAEKKPGIDRIRRLVRHPASSTANNGNTFQSATTRQRLAGKTAGNDAQCKKFTL